MFNRLMVDGFSGGGFSGGWQRKCTGMLQKIAAFFFLALINSFFVVEIERYR